MNEHIILLMSTVCPFTVGVYGEIPQTFYELKHNMNWLCQRGELLI